MLPWLQQQPGASCAIHRRKRARGQRGARASAAGLRTGRAGAGAAACGRLAAADDDDCNEAAPLLLLLPLLLLPPAALRALAALAARLAASVAGVAPMPPGAEEEEEEEDAPPPLPLRPPSAKAGVLAEASDRPNSLSSVVARRVVGLGGALIVVSFLVSTKRSENDRYEKQWTGQPSNARSVKCRLISPKQRAAAQRNSAQTGARSGHNTARHRATRTLPPPLHLRRGGRGTQHPGEGAPTHHLREDAAGAALDAAAVQKPGVIW